MNVEDGRLLKLGDRVEWTNGNIGRGTVVEVFKQQAHIQWDGVPYPAGLHRFSGFDKVTESD